MDPNQNQSNSTEKIQELSIVVTDKFRHINKYWWYTVLIVFVLCFPLYFVLKSTFATVIVNNHKFPAFIYEQPIRVPLEITEKRIYKYTDSSYIGYFKIKNSANSEWGVANQAYTVIFRTTGGTEVHRIIDATFVLPATEKIVVLPRFTSLEKEPTEILVELGPTQFTQKSNLPNPKLDIQSVTRDFAGGKLVVRAAIKNNTPFTITRVDLPVLLYNPANQIVGVAYTNINDLKYQETRTFQFDWPIPPTDNTRVEILPEVNLFDRNIYKLPPGESQFDSVNE